MIFVCLSVVDFVGVKVFCLFVFLILMLFHYTLSSISVVFNIDKVLKSVCYLKVHFVIHSLIFVQDS